MMRDDREMVTQNPSTITVSLHHQIGKATGIEQQQKKRTEN